MRVLLQCPRWCTAQLIAYGKALNYHPQVGGDQGPEIPHASKQATEGQLAPRLQDLDQDFLASLETRKEQV
eukprot:6481688-Amphidinium_carterae.1